MTVLIVSKYTPLVKTLTPVRKPIFVLGHMTSSLGKHNVLGVQLLIFFAVCEIKREEDIRVHKIFQDPQAQHLLVCLESKDTFYISRGGTKRPQPRPLPKFKNTLLESVAWNKIEQTDSSTGAILVGTNQGKLQFHVGLCFGHIPAGIICLFILWFLLLSMPNTGSPHRADI